LDEWGDFELLRRERGVGGGGKGYCESKNDNCLRGCVGRYDGKIKDLREKKE